MIEQRARSSVSVCSGDRSPRILLYLININRNGYLIAKTLSLAGYDVWVRSEISLNELQNLSSPGPAECEYFSWLFSDEEIRAAKIFDDVPMVDCLVYEIGHKRPRYPDELRAWIAKSERVIAWNTNDHERAWWQNLRAEVAALVKFADFLPRTRAVVMQSGRTFLRATALFSRPRRQGYFVHPKFLRDPALGAEMFGAKWSPDQSRPVRLVFSGNAEPETRRCLMEELDQFLKSRSNVRLVNHYKDMAQESILAPDAKALVLWMVRAGSNDRRWDLRQDVVPPVKWPGVLRLCDFVLCPPGYERKTHRVVESLLQGVIPILDCPEEYDLGLGDGVNCLVVRDGSWSAALNRALRISEPEILRLRRNVWILAQAKLRIPCAAQDWLKKFGFQTVPISAPQCFIV